MISLTCEIKKRLISVKVKNEWRFWGGREWEEENWRDVGQIYKVSVKNKFTSTGVMIYDNVFYSLKTQEQFSPKGDNKVR